jgi:hypothetical protein
MPTFDDLSGEPRRRKPAVLPLPGARLNVATGKWEGPTLPLDIIALGEREHDEVLEEARAFAIKHGLSDPKPEDELYERGLMVHTLVRSCLDQAVTDEEKPFFPGGAEQILASRVMLPELIAYLYQLQQLQQDEANPLIKEQTPAEYMAALVKTAGGDMTFFVSSRPSTLWNFTRSLAAQRLVSMTRESPSGGSTESSPTTTSG